MAPTVGPKSNSIQNIKYTGSETEYCTKIKGDLVIVNCKEGVHNHGSSKVKLIDRIDYNWEFHYYPGHLVAAHICGKVIAYGMKGKDGGMVRVTNQETNQRTLIKNLKEEIKDLSFAFSRVEIILGCIDVEGNILIYQINDSPQSISYTLLLHVYRHGNRRSNLNYRLIWCPYLPNFEDDGDPSDDPEKMFVVLNGNKAEVYNVAIIKNTNGQVAPIDPDGDTNGFIEINHTSEVVDASFSSDGTAIAIASSDGLVKFFQLYISEKIKQKCLHEWKPHDNAPLSCIIFIDNIIEYSSECWKFTITGANNNSEIKLWSCESWTCIQTIHFKPNPSSLISGVYLNVALDYSGEYLVISDVNDRVIYLLHLNRNDKEQIVHVTTLSQFLLPAPFLSFHILEAGRRMLPSSYDNSNEDLYDDREDFEEETEETEKTAVYLKMLVIQPKKFQECNIIFQPENLMHESLNSSKELEKSEEKEMLPKLDDLQESVTLLIQQQSNSNNLTLMTPDDFTSPGHRSRPNSVRNDVITSHEKSVDEINEPAVENLIDFQRPQKDNFASGGSSPSREVQEILSLNNSTYSTKNFFDDLTKLQNEQEEPQKEYVNQKDGQGFQKSVSSEIVWPSIPVVKEDDIIKDENLRKELRLNSREETSQIQALTFRISGLENTVKEQNTHLQKLQKDIMNKDELVSEIDCAMKKQQLNLAKMMENLVNLHRTKEQELKEHIVITVTQSLSKSLSEKMKQMVSQEVKQILPSIRNLIESYRTQVDAQYTKKLANTDKMLQETVSKAFNSKALTDSVSSSVVNIVGPSLETSYRDIISSSLIPSWERVCGQMFQQINDAFSRGTKEYTASVENYMDRQRRVQEKGKDLIVQMQTVSENMRTNAEKLTSNLTSDLIKHFSVVFKSLQEKLILNINEVVSDQVRQGFKNHATVLEDSVINAVRSRAVTPSPHVDTHVVSLGQIQQCLSKGNLDEAFQMALSAENLNYVIYVCERVDVQALFGEECILQQSCLLALIQQLSMELHKNTELKLSYIRAAFLALAPNCVTSKHFIPKVLKELLKQLNNFIITSPPLTQSKEAKLLKMAVESMLVK